MSEEDIHTPKRTLLITHTVGILNALAEFGLNFLTGPYSNKV